MGTTLSQLATDVANRLNDPGNVFYSTQEIYWALAEGMCEASIITGEPVVTQQGVSLTAGQTVQAVPSGMMAVQSVVGTGSTAVLGVAMGDLDAQNPAWENDQGDSVANWIPLGIGKFGVYPKLTAPQTVTVVGLAYPVSDMAALTGAEQSPFETGYDDMLVSYASSILRLKQGGNEFSASTVEYQRFLDQCGLLSRWAIRTGSLRFASGLGFGLGTTSKEVG